MSRFAEKQVDRLPQQIREKFITWVNLIHSDGMLTMRKISGFHDEPLRGVRSGQRSVRLNRSYRIIYEEIENAEIVVIGVIEVNKHDY